MIGTLLVRSEKALFLIFKFGVVITSVWSWFSFYELKNTISRTFFHHAYSQSNVLPKVVLVRLSLHLVDEVEHDVACAARKSTPASSGRVAVMSDRRTT